jgi:hypothetical protein
MGWKPPCCFSALLCAPTTQHPHFALNPPHHSTGRIVFLSGRSQVLVVLEGNEECLSDYLVRHRTQPVDVDSRGRKVGHTHLRYMLRINVCRKTFYNRLTDSSR